MPLLSFKELELISTRLNETIKVLDYLKDADCIPLTNQKNRFEYSNKLMKTLNFDKSGSTDILVTSEDALTISNNGYKEY